jgi:hypothetical protein
MQPAKDSVPRGASYLIITIQRTNLPNTETVLATEFELLENILIFLVIFFAQVVEKAATFTNHLQETTARMLVLLVSLEVLGKFFDLLSEDGNLNLRRTGVLLVSLH